MKTLLYNLAIFFSTSVAMECCRKVHELGKPIEWGVMEESRYMLHTEKKASGTEQSCIKRKLGIHISTHVQYNIPISMFTFRRYFSEK